MIKKIIGFVALLMVFSVPSFAGGFDLSLRAPLMADGIGLYKGNSDFRISGILPILDSEKQTESGTPLMSVHLNAGIGLGEDEITSTSEQTVHLGGGLTFRDFVHVSYVYDFGKQYALGVASLGFKFD